MPRWIEPLESRRLLSVTVPHGHNRAAHRLDVKTTQVEIEAKIVQVDLKSVRQLGAQFLLLNPPPDRGGPSETHRP